MTENQSIATQSHGGEDRELPIRNSSSQMKMPFVIRSLPTGDR